MKKATIVKSESYPTAKVICDCVRRAWLIARKEDSTKEEESTYGYQVHDPISGLYSKISIKIKITPKTSKK